MKPKFASGDKVFAKVRGYPYWPAKIISPQDENASRIKYDIVFYGTGEKAVVKAEDVQPFLEKRCELGRPKKQKAFNDAMAAIESDLNTKDMERLDNTVDTAVEETSTPTTVKRKSSAMNISTQSLDLSLSEELGNTSGQAKVARGRRKRSRVEVEESSTPKAEVSRTPRKSKAKRKSEDSCATSPRPYLLKRKPLDKLEDRCRFDLDGVNVSIAINSNRPPLKCPKNMLDWNRLVTDKASELKDKVIDGSISLDTAQQEMDEFTRVKSKEKRKEYDDNEQEFKILKIEGKLLNLDVKIKSCLTIAKANPSEALKHLDEILSLQITPLMLKKHPEIVDTFKKLSHYVGNSGSWTLSGKEEEEFVANAGLVRSKAQETLDKFKALFSVPHDQLFSRFFLQQLRDFNRATEKLSQEEFFSLVKEPDLRVD